jgi:hypothetical protein
MIIDKEIEILVKSPRTISKLREIEIIVNIGDLIKIPIDKLWISSNIKINVKCDICQNIKYINFSMYNKNIKKYNIYTCSNKCAVFKNKKTCLNKYGDENYNNTQKRLDNNLIRFGVDNPMRVEGIKLKVKDTKLERYGDENYNNRLLSNKTKLERYGDENYNNRNNYKLTIFQRYGVKHYSKTEEYKDKVKSTCLERYSVSNYSKTEEYKDKVKSTCLEKYGLDSSNKSDIIKKKKVLSMLNKYGFISNSMTQDSKDKLKKTNLERYGVEYPMQVLEFLEKQQKKSKKIKYYNDILYYQSSYEKDFLDHCFEINLLNDISRGPTIRYVKDGKEKFHYPDFYIEKYNLIIEIKSDYYYYKYIETNKIKLKTAINIGYNYLFIINKKYYLFDEIINNI